MDIRRFDTRWRCATVMLMALGPLGAVRATAFEDQDNILRTARTFLTDLQQRDHSAQTVQIHLDSLDPRVQVTRCDHAVRAELAPGSRGRGLTTVRVYCEQPVRWSLLVPARVTVMGTVLVVARPLGRGQRITAADVTTEPRDLSALPNGYFDHPNSVIGLQAKRALVPGQVFNSGQVTQPVLIQRGQMVTLRSGHGGVQVDMPGEALADGMLGQRIRVQNQSSQRTVEGTVEADGVVRVQ